MISVAGLHLNDQRHFPVDQLQHFRKCGNAFFAVEKMKLLQLFQRIIRCLSGHRFSFCVPYDAFHRIVMENHRNAVSGKLHIQFNSVSVFFRKTKRGHRVFRNAAFVII